MNNVFQTRKTKLIVYGLGATIGVFVLMQFGRFVIPAFKPDNPPVTNTINWDSPETQQLWNRACADCHSNETIYPWYSYVAPVGWLVAHDVHEGRDHMNVSEGYRINTREIAKVVGEGEMPPQIYTVMHPNAILTDAEKQALVDGLRATFSNGS